MFKCFLPLEKLTANCKLQTFWGVLPVASMGVMLMVNRVISSGLSEIAEEIEYQVREHYDIVGEMKKPAAKKTKKSSEDEE